MLELDEILRGLRQEVERIERAIAILEGIPPSSDLKPKRRGRKSMSEEERLVFSVRMRQHWAKPRRAGE